MLPQIIIPSEEQRPYAAVQLPRRHADEVDVAHHGPALGPAILGQKAHDGEEGLALARAGFAHHGQRLALGEAEIHLADGMHLALVQREGNRHIFDFEDLFHLSDPWGRERRAGRPRYR